MAGHDPKDATSINAPVPAVVNAAKSGDVKGMKIGVIKQLQGEGYQKGVQTRFDESLQVLASLGAEIVEVDCPSFEYALAAYYLIAPSECSSNLARFDAMRYGLRTGDVDGASAEAVMSATRDAGFGREVKRRIILGTYALSSGYYDAYYGSAQKIRTLIIQDYAKAFAQADVLVSPTAPTTAYKIGEKVDDPMAMYLGDVATIPVNLAVSAECHFLQVLPMKITCQLVSRSWLQRCRISVCIRQAQHLKRRFFQSGAHRFFLKHQS